ALGGAAAQAPLLVRDQRRAAQRTGGAHGPGGGSAGRAGGRGRGGGAAHAVGGRGISRFYARRQKARGSIPMSATRHDGKHALAVALRARGNPEGRGRTPLAGDSSWAGEPRAAAE